MLRRKTLRSGAKAGVMLAYLRGSLAFAAVGADPKGSGPLVKALLWIQGSLMGNVATTVAALSVAMVGFMMLTGRMNWRLGATVIIGCFILFGSASIVSGIRATTALTGY